MQKKLQDLSLNSNVGWKNFADFRSQGISGLATGVSKLDSALRGLSGIVGIQGEPGSCKSTFALQVAVHNSLEGTPVLIVDRENGENRFRQRILSQVNGISRDEVLKCHIDKLRGYYNAVRDLPVYVETSYDVNLEVVKGYLEEMQAEYPAKKMLLVVDSLQALPKRKDDERLALQEWIEGLDQLKLDFKGQLVILMTSEKSRGKYDRASKDAGKGTGSIEFKCEQLIDMRAMSGGLIAAQVVKNRDGACSNDLYLAKCLAANEESSFTFKLREANQIEINRLEDHEERF